MPKNSRTTLKSFLLSVKPFRLALIFAILLAITSAILGLFTPKLLGKMTNIAIDSYATGIDWVALAQKAILIIVLFMLSAITSYAQSYIMAVAVAKYTKSLRTQIIEKISRLPISYFDKHQFGDTLSRMANDIDIIAASMSQEFISICTSIVTLLGYTIIMFTISTPLTFISLIIIPFSVFVVGKIAKFAQKYFRQTQNTLGNLNSKIEENYSGILIVKSNSHESTTIADFVKTNNELAETTKKAQIFSSLSMPVTHIFTNLGYVATCITGGYLVINGQISIGNLQSFIGYVSRFNRPITEAASTISTIQSILAASERIFEFLNEAEETPDPALPEAIKKVKGAVEFKNVNFSYDKKTPIIKNFSAKITPGSQVAIVGPTGAGKTTLINLLMRFYDPDSGGITIDGVSTQNMKRSDVRKLFGMVLQDTWLFSGTIADNLKYGNAKATLSDIKSAAKHCDIDHVIESLPDNYRTVINEDSDNISAGEKQLLTIARAMIANPPMIILDEATSNVDTRTEELVQAAFDKLTRGRTSFVIAHRLSTIKNADLILVLKDGNIVEQGTHTELLKKAGFYADLYNSQFSED